MYDEPISRGAMYRIDDSQRRVIDDYYNLTRQRHYEKARQKGMEDLARMSTESMANDYNRPRRDFNPYPLNARESMEEYMQTPPEALSENGNLMFTERMEHIGFPERELPKGNGMSIKFPKPYNLFDLFDEIPFEKIPFSEMPFEDRPYFSVPAFGRYMFGKIGKDLYQGYKDYAKANQMDMMNNPYEYMD